MTASFDELDSPTFCVRATKWMGAYSLMPAEGGTTN